MTHGAVPRIVSFWLLPASGPARRVKRLSEGAARGGERLTEGRLGLLARFAGAPGREEGGVVSVVAVVVGSSLLGGE